MDDSVTHVIGALVPIVLFVSVFTFVTVSSVFHSRDRRLEREKLYDTARAAVEKGQPLPPEVIASLAQGKAKRTAFDDLRSGIFTTAAGLGLVVLGAIVGWDEADPGEIFLLHPLVGIAAIPLLIGIAQIVLSRFNPNKGPQG